MRFKVEEVDNFLELFRRQSPLIRGFEGCQHLELWRDSQETADIYTFSIWESEAALEAYRQSALFSQTWAETKRKFRDKPAAWSMEQLMEVKPNKL